MNRLVADRWLPVLPTDDRARSLYLRHYSQKRRSEGNRRISPQFVGPGEKMVLLTLECDAVFAWLKAYYRKDGQQGIECTIFRNEGQSLSSTLIREAVDLAWRRWPGERLFTYVNAASVESPNPGYCFKVAGWRYCGLSKGGLHLLEMLPDGYLYAST